MIPFASWETLRIPVTSYYCWYKFRHPYERIEQHNDGLWSVSESIAVAIPWFCTKKWVHEIAAIFFPLWQNFLQFRLVLLQPAWINYLLQLQRVHSRQDWPRSGHWSKTWGNVRAGKKTGLTLGNKKLKSMFGGLPLWIMTWNLFHCDFYTIISQYKQ